MRINDFLLMILIITYLNKILIKFINKYLQDKPLITIFLKID